MSLRFVLSGPLLLSLLLVGCAQEPLSPPGPEAVDPPEEASPPPEGEPPPAPPAPSPLRIPIPPELREAGAVVTVSRLHASQPARESVTVVAAGAQEFEVATAEGEVLAVAVQDRAGVLVEGAMVAAGAAAWPGQGRLPRMLQVPREYATLQAAVDAARSGDTVLVAPGTYRETVRLKSGIRLVGSGAWRTFLDGGGQPVKLVDFSGSRDVVIAGFTFQNVGPGSDGCSQLGDVMRCGGEWYPAALFADGHTDLGEEATSALVMHNVFRTNFLAVMLYFHARAVVRNNVFVDNVHGFVANHFQDVALVENNVFWNHGAEAIVSQAASLDIVNNVIVRSKVGILHAHIQTGRIRCNLFFQNEAHGADVHSVPPRFTLGEDGNVELDPLFEDPFAGNFLPQVGSPLRDAGCFEGHGFDLDGTRQDLGAYGGPLGRWP